MTNAELEAAREFIKHAMQLQAGGSKEAVLIRNLVSFLPSMFPKGTTWLSHHIRDAEHQVQYGSESGERRAFIDSLVGYTTIEYEHDLRKAGVFQTGLGQVRQHVAGLINAKVPVEKIIGVLSDTLQWRAYRVKDVRRTGATVRPEDVELEEIDNLDLTGGSAQDPERLIGFLSQHLGRAGARRLAASTIAFDVGFDSEFARTQIRVLDAVVARAFGERPDYANVVQKLWTDFVAYIGETTQRPFDVDVYVSELYVVTLAKLMCANIIASKALTSDDTELAKILDGSYFRARGLENLVEYDYFGWLNSDPYIQALIPVAREVQRGLRSYDFDAPAAEDLFGQLLAQLAERSKRALLGQEATPPWLAKRMANELLERLPANESPRFIDMACGSGPMLVEVVRARRRRVGATLTAAEIAELTQVATGFDIDPLAVMLAKVNWVVASREWLAPFDGSRRVSIPIYLADSLFAKTPIGEVHASTASYALALHDTVIQLPSFLVSPEFRAIFDALIDRAYVIGMAAAVADKGVATADVRAAIAEASSDSAVSLTAEQQGTVETFLQQLIEALARLQQQKLNGIWAFILRNSYRPGLVLGQFNGLISNPPWLALSKFADNPYHEVLRREAETYGIKPGGSAFLHVELATTFLLHAVDNYLRDGAVIACVLPETILNGAQHEPLRRGRYGAARRPVQLNVEGLWRVQSGTFKNEAVVLIGERIAPSKVTSFPGALVSETSDEPLTFQVIELASRSAWTDSASSPHRLGLDELQFKQGADFFPRTAIFHDVTPIAGDRASLKPIDKSKSDLGYLLDQAKKMASFKLTPTTVPDRFLFDVLLSKHVAPFEMAAPALGLLPFERDEAGEWRPVSDTSLAASPQAKAGFDEILGELSRANGHPMTVQGYFDTVDMNYRKKLRDQQFDQDGYLVVFGAGGGPPAAACAALAGLRSDRLVIDQTLYWSCVSTEDEALYLTGLLNSPALDEAIAKFQPHGQFGRRHIHELPLKVTPGFVQANLLHQKVVDATRSLIAEYQGIRKDPAYARYLEPTANIGRRRSVLRTIALPSLPSYQAYVAACRAVYESDAAAEVAGGTSRAD